MIGTNPGWAHWVAQSAGGDVWIRRGAFMPTGPVTRERTQRDIAYHARTYWDCEPPVLIAYPPPRPDHARPFDQP